MSLFLRAAALRSLPETGWISISYVDFKKQEITYLKLKQLDPDMIATIACTLHHSTQASRCLAVQKTQGISQPGHPSRYMGLNPSSRQAQCGELE